MGDTNPAVIIDNGSGRFKAGFAGEDTPRVDFPSIIGRPKYKNTMYPQKELYVGDEALANKLILNLQNPIVHNYINDYDDMKLIWNHCFNQLRVNPSEQPCVLTEASMNSKLNREQMVKIMFEKFNVPSLNISIQAVLSLYSTGRVTGIVVDSGDDYTHIVPIYNCSVLNYAIKSLQIDGKDLTDYCIRLMYEIGLQYSSSSERDIIRDIKEKCCYVALDYEQEQRDYKNNSFKHVQYKLPNGELITIQDFRFRVPELLFKPHFIGKEQRGLSELIFDSIMACDLDIRKELYENIVLSGGITMFKNIEQRVAQDIRSLAPSFTNVKVLYPSERKCSAFLGGSLLFSLQSFESDWITQKEYDESGPSIVHRKFF